MIATEEKMTMKGVADILDVSKDCYNFFWSLKKIYKKIIACFTISVYMYLSI